MSENPFAARGLAISGDEFIGRGVLLKKIGHYISGPNRTGNLALIGIPAIGKSSLVKQFLYLNEQVIIASRILPIKLNLGEIESIKHLHLGMVTAVLGKLETLNELSGDNPILMAGNEAARLLNSAETVTDENNAIKSFYFKVKEAKWEITFILDNFDEAKKKFPSKSAFQQLLSLLEDHYFSLITLSRERLYQIERTTPALSQLSKVLSEEYIPMFSQDEVDSLLMKLRLFEIELTDEISEKAQRICGNHPFLLNLFCNHLVNQKIYKGQLKEDFSFDEVAGISDYFQKLNDWLRKISQPKANPQSVDIKDLIRYHVVKESNANSRIPFSECFKSYLSDYEF